MRTIQKFMTLVLILVIGISAIPGAAQENELDYQLYLPILMKNNPNHTIFGVEVNRNGFMDEASSAGNHWVRYNGLLWSEVQPEDNTQFIWNSTLEENLIAASTSGMEMILIVRSAPYWAQKYKGISCGPIHKDALKDFASFMNKVVERYSAYPFNIKHFEIWNEPDVSYQYNTILMGCWGEPNDPYFGGGYYAEMLKVVYPAMKAANPAANLVLGGLLLDCDPRNYGIGSGYCQTYEETKPPKFIEGILLNGGGYYFDVMSFHGYPSYSQIDFLSGVNPINRERNFYKWKAAGGVVAGKLDYIHDLMSKYGINKPIFHTEGAVLLPTDDSPWTPEFETAKTNYLPWLYARNWSKGIAVTNWYTLNGPGWRQSALLDGKQQPRESYKAFSFMIEILGKAEFVSYTVLEDILPEPYYDPNEVHQFEFITNEKRIWLLFGTRDNYSRNITIPANFLQAFDVVGSPVYPVGDTITFERPIYIEMSK